MMVMNSLSDAKAVLDTYGFEMHPTVKKALAAMIAEIESLTNEVSRLTERLRSTNAMFSEILEGVGDALGIDWPNDQRDPQALVDEAVLQRSNLEEVRSAACKYLDECPQDDGVGYYPFEGMGTFELNALAVIIQKTAPKKARSLLGDTHDNG